MTGRSFRYDADRVDRLDGTPTLHEIDLVARSGTRTAVGGETGAGKTRLADLIARLYDVYEGPVLLDRHDVRELTLDSVSGAVGLVAQHTYLFHDTLGVNLRFAAADGTDTDLAAALRAARIDRVVASLTQGYDIVAGASRACFSGRERAVETGHAVQAALDELARGRTTIAIARGLSTAGRAHHTLVPGRVRLVERGMHLDLRSRGGRYVRLAGELTG